MSLPNEPTYSLPAPPKRRSWFARHKLLTAFGALIALSLIGSALGSDEDTVADKVSSASPTPTATYSPPPVVEEPTPESTAIQQVPFVRKNYRKVTSRQYALIVKNPDAHKQKKIIIYGKVTQFDAATGEETFLADTDAYRRPLDESWQYDHSAAIGGAKKLLANVVEDDVLQMYVTVISELSYDTQIGGNTTVPLFRVDSLKVLGHDE